MTWFKVDDGFAFHRKAVQAGNAAIGLWTRAGAWCGQNLSDGHIPLHIVRVMGTVAQADRLVRAGLWIETEDGYQFHDWTQCNPSGAKVRQEQKRAAANQQSYRDRKKDQGNFSRDQGKNYRTSPEHPRSDGVVSDNEPMATVGSGKGSPNSAGSPPARKEEPSGSSSSEPKRSDGDKRDQPGQRDDVERLCAHLADRVEQQVGKRPSVGVHWRRPARLLLDADHYTEEQVHRAIDWCQDDEFWRSNILSMSKLREKYVQLRAAAGRRGSNGTPLATSDQRAIMAIEAGRRAQARDDALQRKELEA